MPVIVEQSQARLRLKARTPRLVLALLLCASLAWLYGMCPTLKVLCAKTETGQTECVIQKSLFGLTLSSRAVLGVTNAFVQTTYTSDGKHRDPHRQRASRQVARAVLESPGGALVPVTRSYSSEIELHRQIAAFVNRVISKAAPSSETLAHSPTVARIVAAILVLALSGLALIQGECVLDKHSDRLTLWRLGLGRGEPAEYPLSSVERFFVSRENTSRGNSPWKLRARLDSGAEINLPDLGGGAGKRHRLVQVLEKFRQEAQQTHRIPEPQWSGGGKVCVICQHGCENEERMQDEAGRYYHRACYERAVSALRQS